MDCTAYFIYDLMKQLLGGQSKNTIEKRAQKFIARISHRFHSLFSNFISTQILNFIFMLLVKSRYDSVACNFVKKEILAEAFSCEFCQISKNTFFTEHLWTIASIYMGWHCNL